MAKIAGTLNKKTAQTLQEYFRLCDKYIDPMEFLFQCLNGKVEGVRKKPDMIMRLAAARELMSYGHAKQATLKHVIEAPSATVITWDLFDDERTIEGSDTLQTSQIADEIAPGGAAV